MTCYRLISNSQAIYCVILDVEQKEMFVTPLLENKSKKMYPPLSIVNKNVPPSFTWFWKLCSPFTLPSCDIINDRFLKCVIYLNVAIFTGSRNLPMQLFEKY